MFLSAPRFSCRNILGCCKIGSGSPDRPQFELFGGRFKFDSSRRPSYGGQVGRMNTDRLNLKNLLPNISLIKCSVLLARRVVINSFSNTWCTQAYTPQANAQFYCFTFQTVGHWHIL